MTEWIKTTLGEIAVLNYGLVDGPFGSNLPASNYTEHGIPVIRGSNLSTGASRFDDSAFVYVSEETAKRLARSICMANDIIFTKKGTLGQTGFIPKNHLYSKFLLSSNQMKLTVNQEIANPLYVFYVVSSPQSIEKIIRDASVTGVPKTNVTYLRTFPICLPPLETQHKIAAILSAYDDLIENNTRRIQALEQAAHDLYREWFVEFRFPGHESVEMVDSGTDYGMIPQGWEVVLLEEVVELAYGKSLKADDRIAGDFPVYGSSGIIGSHVEYLVESPGIIVGRKGNVGSVFWAEHNFYPIDTVYYVNTDLCLHYVYYNLQHQNFINNDAAVPGLSRRQAYALPFVVPSDHVLEQFQNFVAPVFEQIHTMSKKNNALREARDLLLPRLVSGQLDVSDVELGIDTE